MMDMVIFVSAFVDKKLYATCITENPFIKDNPHCQTVGADNTHDNQCVPRRYNQFLDSHDYTSPAWFVFCHSDWELRENLNSLLVNLDKNCLYGPIGAILYTHPNGHLIREYRGQCFEQKRDGSMERQLICASTYTGLSVDVFDCQCVIMHSSLVAKYNLRFDERLNFDLYVEDFCINAKNNGVKSKILNLHCCHWSPVDSMDDRPQYFCDLEYLNQKYPDTIHAGVITLIGGQSTSKHCVNIIPEVVFTNTFDDNRITGNRSIIYSSEVDPSAPNESKSVIFRYVTPNSTILDVGCACGDLGLVLKQKKQCNVYGLEYNKNSIDLARKSGAYEKINQVDLNFIPDNAYPEYFEKFDYIIFGDVLEHVLDPQDAIRKMLCYLKPNGYLLISLPNIAHASIKGNLLLNDFSYTEVGLLDKTHIRFFTHKSIPEFLAKNRLTIEDYKYVVFDAPGLQPENPYPSLSQEVLYSIFSDPHSFVWQYVIKARIEDAKAYEQCLAANRVVHTLDPAANPTLDVYRNKALRAFADRIPGQRTRTVEGMGRKIYRHARDLFVKSIICVNLLPATMVYAGSFANWARQMRRPRALFSAVIHQSQAVTNRTQSMKPILAKTVNLPLKTGLFLAKTNSLRETLKKTCSAARIRK